MKTLFVVCQHGDEVTPLKVIKGKFADKVEYLVANKQAVKKGVRYIESDLNRSFPGTKDGTAEEKLSKKLMVRLDKFGGIVDLHTATCETPIFVILTKVTDKHLELVRRLGVKRVVMMQKSIASGGSMIDHVAVGVSVECGHEKHKETATAIKEMLEHYLSGRKQLRLECFTVFEILKQTAEQKELPEEIKSFKKAKLMGKEFYPVLARETHYKGVLCLMAKKISLKELVMLK